MTETVHFHPTAPTVESTLAFIKGVYGDRKDKGKSHLLYEHPIAVMNALPPLPAKLTHHLSEDEVEALTNDYKMAALLHDIVEDTAKADDGYSYAYMIDDLRDRGYSERVLRIVSNVTKIPGVGVYQQGMDYPDWVNAIIATGDPLTILLKHTDVKLNRSPERIRSLPTPELQELQTNKYRVPFIALDRAVNRMDLLPQTDLPGH